MEDRFEGSDECTDAVLDDLDPKFQNMLEEGTVYADAGTNLADWVDFKKGGKAASFEQVEKMLDTAVGTVQKNGCSSEFVHGHYDEDEIPAGTCIRCSDIHNCEATCTRWGTSAARTIQCDDDACPAVVGTKFTGSDTSVDFDVLEFAVWAHYLAEASSREYTGTEQRADHGESQGARLPLSQYMKPESRGGFKWTDY